MFQRCVLVVELDKDVEAAWNAARKLMTQPEKLVLLAYLNLPVTKWLHPNAWSEINKLMAQKEKELQVLQKRLSPSLPLEIQLVTELTPELVSEVVQESRADLAVLSSLSFSIVTHLLPWFSEITRTTDIPVVWLSQHLLEQHTQKAPSEHTIQQQEGPQKLLCLGNSELRRLPRMLQMLREKTHAQHQIIATSISDTLPPISQEQLDYLKTMLGIQGSVSVAHISGTEIKVFEWVRDKVRLEKIDLVCLPLEEAGQSIYQLPFLGQYILEQIDAPLLCVPPHMHAETDERELHPTDVLWLEGTPLHLFIEETGLWGMTTSPFEGSLTCSVQGQEPVSLSFQNGLGTAHFTSPQESKPLALGLGLDEGSETKGHFLETFVRVIHPEQYPLVLFDLELPDISLQKLTELQCPEQTLFVGVRLQRNRLPREDRERLQACGLTPWVLDASQLLDDGNPSDIPPGTESLRLFRVALRLRTYGLQLFGIIVKESHLDKNRGFSIVDEAQLEQESLDWDTLFAQHFQPPTTRDTKLSFSALTQQMLGAQISTGNALQLQIDNKEAREHLIQLFTEAKERIHIQVYIIHDDAITQAFEKALVEAASRGVQVRILVDSLYSMHGSFFRQNTWIQRIQHHSGIECHFFRPIEGLPDLTLLKQRDHRKLIIVDGQKGSVTGRNFALSYYQDFSEIQLQPQTSEDDIPWLDAGVSVEGPILQEMDKVFLEAWEQAGGSSFSILPAEPKGDICCQLVIHEGLKDTHTLDAQLAMLRTAQKHLLLVNTFPLLREFQHALLQATQRGIQVRFLFGNVRPLYQGQTLAPFPGNPLRELAMQVIYSRMDALIEAGAEVFELVLKRHSHWHSEIEAIRPHVHAKVLTSDGNIAAIGSANFDVTGAFWESEALLLIEDTKFVQQVDATFHNLMQNSVQILPDDPNWQKKAARRKWLDRLWPSIIA